MSLVRRQSVQTWLTLALVASAVQTTPINVASPTGSACARVSWCSFPALSRRR
jgi:hypothetical protein